MDAATKEKFSKRCGLTIRVNALQHQILWEAAWQERRSMSAIIRECVAEYCRLKYNWSFPAVLTDLSIEEQGCEKQS